MPAAPLSDADLVARCRGGDGEAWAELVTRYSRYVYAIAVQAFRLREADAEDVFQDVFSRVYERIDSLRNVEALRPWIGQLTRRVCIDHLRSESREQPTADEELVAADAEDTVSRLDEAFAVHESLARLSGNCQEILDRFFARDESYRAIGEALDLPSGTIASRISRCLTKLRDEYEGRNLPSAPSGGQVT